MTGPRIGVIIHDRDSRPDVVFHEAVLRLKARGVRVGGLLQDGDRIPGPGCKPLYLEDIGSGRRARLFQDRGRGTRGCRLDASGLAEAAAWLREAIERRPDILFVNRFGRQEAEGRGLLDEIGAAVMADIPMVIAVGQSLLPEWQSFVGEAIRPLEPLPDAVETWCLAQLQAERTAAG